MSTPVKVRRLTDHEGRQLQQIVRRGGGRSEKSIVRWRRAMVVMASASGNTVPACASSSSTWLKTIRAARPDDQMIYVILDNLSAHKGIKIRTWATKHPVELCYSLSPAPGRATTSCTTLIGPERAFRCCTPPLF